MTARTLLIIRHAEKPDAEGNSGVDANGAADSKSLTPRGWQRAGAWAQVFVPSFGKSSLPTPIAIFASAPASHQEIAAGAGGSKSRRPLETITPLAERLGIEVDLTFAKGQEPELAAVISNASGVVLVCWQHENIFAIADAMDPKPTGVPAQWPGSRFNVLYRFDFVEETGGWRFQQVVPVMLDGDDETEI